jgi:hypothetical protein
MVVCKNWQGHIERQHISPGGVLDSEGLEELDVKGKVKKGRSI